LDSFSSPQNFQEQLKLDAFDAKENCSITADEISK